MAAGSIVIDLLMRTGAFETDTKRAEARLKKFGDAAAITASSLAGAAGVAGALGAVATVLGGFVKQINDGVDALNDFADATGTTVENASALEDIARRNGASFDTAQSSLVKFNSVLKDVKPGTDAANILKTIGLNAEALKRIDPAQALLETATALSKFADDGAKARAIQELFGKSVKEAAPFLKDLAEKGKLVATVTAQDAAEAETFSKNLAQLSKDLTDAGRAMAGPVVSGLNGLILQFKEANEQGEGFLKTLLRTTEIAQMLGMGPLATKVEPTGSWGEPDRPSLLRNRQQMGIGGGGTVDWELFEENRRKATEASEDAIRKAREATRKAEQLAATERQDAWEIEKKNIMGMFEAEVALREEFERLTKSVETPMETLNRELQENDRLLRTNPLVTGELRERLDETSWKKFSDSFKDASKEMDSFAKNAAENIQRNLGDTFVDMMNGNFKSVGDGFVQMINRMVAEALAANLVKSLFGVEGQGGVGSSWLSAVGTFMGFAGAKAGGGDVMANQAYLVGEKGPEMFVPHAAGTIIPHDQGQAGPGATVNNYFNVSIPPSETRRSGTQIAVEAQRKLALGGRNL